MSDPKPDTLDAASQVVVLSFELFDAEIAKLPGQVAKALTSPQVQAAIKKTMLDFAQTRGAKIDTIVSGAEAQKFIAAMQEKTVDAGIESLKTQIAKTSEYKALEKSLENFKKAAASTSLGVWVDENKGVLYVVGALLVVGSATVLYVTKTGGAGLNMALDPLEGKEFDVLKIGNIQFRAGLWDFQPDARIFGARIGAKMAWKKLELDLKLGVLAEGPVIQQVEGAAVLKSGPISLNFTADAKPQAKVVNLALRVDYNVGKNVNIGVGAFYKVPEREKDHVGFFDDRPQYGGMLTISVPFGN